MRPGRWLRRRRSILVTMSAASIMAAILLASCGDGTPVPPPTPTVDTGQWGVLGTAKEGECISEFRLGVGFAAVVPCDDPSATDRVLKTFNLAPGLTPQHCPTGSSGPALNFGPYDRVVCLQALHPTPTVVSVPPTATPVPPTCPDSAPRTEAGDVMLSLAGTVCLEFVGGAQTGTGGKGGARRPKPTGIARHSRHKDIHGAPFRVALRLHRVYARAGCGVPSFCR